MGLIKEWKAENATGDFLEQKGLQIMLEDYIGKVEGIIEENNQIWSTLKNLTERINALGLSKDSPAGGLEINKFELQENGLNIYPELEEDIIRLIIDQTKSSKMIWQNNGENKEVYDQGGVRISCWVDACSYNLSIQNDLIHLTCTSCVEEDSSPFKVWHSIQRAREEREANQRIIKLTRVKKCLEEL